MSHPRDCSALSFRTRTCFPVCYDGRDQRAFSRHDFCDYKCGISQQECAERLREAFQGSAPSRTTVYIWFAECLRGRTSLKDKEHPGLPATAVTEENVARVEASLRQDPRVTYQGIERTIHLLAPCDTFYTSSGERRVPWTSL